MSAEILVPSGYGEAELVEKRSRFIGRVWPVSLEPDALQFLKETRARHWDASHNVYAYILRDAGVMRHSDDGEPQGTAGLPVLDVFRKGGVSDVLCVVTRYFGGTLLGTGGLVRAYGQTASLALAAAGIQRLRHWRRLELVLDYAMLSGARRAFPNLEVIEEDCQFAADVTLTVRAPLERRDELAVVLTELTFGAVLVEDHETVLA